MILLHCFEMGRKVLLLVSLLFFWWGLNLILNSKQVLQCFRQRQNMVYNESGFFSFSWRLVWYSVNRKREKKREVAHFYFFPLFIHGTPTNFTALFLAKSTQIVKDQESAMKSWLGRTTRPLVQYLLLVCGHCYYCWFVLCCGLWFPIVNQNRIRKELVNKVIKVSDLFSSFIHL